MGFYLTALEAGTEGITAEEVSDTIEQMKKPGVVRTYLEGLVPDLLAFLFQVVIACVVYAIGVKLIKLFRKLVQKWLDKKDADKGVKQFMDALVKCIGYFFLIVIILSLFGIATTSVMAIAGSAGLTVGLALQGSLSNFAGGVLILMLKPFKVGDYIVEDSHGNEGTVTEISIFYTKLKSVDNKIIVIPNGILANSSLTNVTYSEKRRIDLEVGVSYSADLKKTKAVIEQLLLSEERRLKDEAVQVFVSELGDSSVIIGARVWVPTDLYWDIRWALTEEMKNALDENRIEIPFPQLDVNVKNPV